MRRRDFLKAMVGAAAAAYVAPIAAADNYPDFDPRRLYGEYVTLSFDGLVQKGDPLIQLAIRRLDKTIKATIPPEYRWRIGWIITKPRPLSRDPLLRRTCVGWKYTPEVRHAR